MEIPRTVTHFPKGCLPSKRKVGEFVRLIAALTLFLLFLLTIVCPVCEAAAKGPGNPPSPLTSNPRLDQGGNTRGAVPQPQENLWAEIGLLAVIALAFAWLKLFTDFHRYKGLLPVLLLSWYSWVFVIFIAALSFAFDYLVWSRWLHNVTPHWFGHLSLALGHTGASAAFVYAVPLVAAKVPPLPSATAGQSHEKKATEMNMVFAAIRESLENRANGNLCDWTEEYDWNVIKYVANMLTIDQVNSEIIAREDGNRLRAEVNAYKSDEDPWVDRQRKYELLRGLMSQSSFNDLRTRLRQASKKRSDSDNRANHSGASVGVDERGKGGL